MSSPTPADAAGIGPVIQAQEEPGTPVGRRVVLAALATGAVGVLAGDRLSRVTEKLGTSTQMSALIPGEGWRLYTVTGTFPYRSAAGYRLTVSGLVHKPLLLTLDDLRRLPATRLTRDFQCVTGWRVPHVEWAGVCLADLLERAGIQPAAKAVSFFAFDGIYTESLTLPEALRPDVLVAYTMDDKPLSRVHGGPVRLLAAPMFGYKSCKWLRQIRVDASLRRGYWERYGYPQEAWVGNPPGQHENPIFWEPPSPAAHS